MDKVDKPPEPKSTPEEKQVSEVKESTSGSSEEVRPDEKAKMESELGRLRQELGEERKAKEELNAYKLWYDQNAARMQQQVPQQKEQQPKNYDEQFFDKPTETFKKLLNEYEMGRQYQDAFQTAPTAFAQAKMMYPDRFEGVDENMVQQIMYAPVQQGQMNPAVLKDPNLWAGAAWIAKGQQTGYTVPQTGPSSLNPTQIETPSNAQPTPDNEIPDIRGDALTDTFIEKAKAMGITKEEFLKEVEATRQEGGD